MSTPLIKAQATLEAARRRHKDELLSLEREVKAARRAEVKAIVAQIKAVMQQYEITAADLGFKVETKAAKGHPLSGRKIPPKVVHPTTGQKWAGRGTKPQWVKELEAKTKGKTKAGQRSLL